MADTKTPRGFRWTVSKVPDGRASTLEEIERETLQELEASGWKSKQAIWNLAIVYSKSNRHEQALDCIQRFLALADDLEERASCYLAMGQVQEQMRDFEAAVRYYRAAFDMKPGNTRTWYFINNNLGYSLIQLGRFEEAEPYLRSAIRIGPDRPNAYKNLGLAFRGRGENVRAAELFVLATRANASDGRSLRHLEELVAAHPELLVEVPGLASELAACRDAVALAASRQPDFDARWQQLRGKQKSN